MDIKSKNTLIISKPQLAGCSYPDKCLRFYLLSMLFHSSVENWRWEKGLKRFIAETVILIKDHMVGV